MAHAPPPASLATALLYVSWRGPFLIWMSFPGAKPCRILSADFLGMKDIFLIQHYALKEPIELLMTPIAYLLVLEPLDASSYSAPHLSLVLPSRALNIHGPFILKRQI